MPIPLLPEVAPQQAPSDPSLEDPPLSSSKLASSNVTSAQPNSSTDSFPHPFDPLSASEIEAAVAIVRKHPRCHDSTGQVNFNAVTLWEPRKADMVAWLADPQNSARPRRVADVVLMIQGGERTVLVDALVDLEEGRVVGWEDNTEGVQPLVRICDLFFLARKRMIHSSFDKISLEVRGLKDFLADPSID